MVHNKSDFNFTHNILRHIQKQFKIIYYFSTINLKMGALINHICACFEPNPITFSAEIDWLQFITYR